MARPKADERQIRITTYVAPDMAAKLEQRAAEKGLNLSAYVRSLIVETLNKKA